MGNSSLAFSIGSFLFGLLLSLAYYLRLKDWPLNTVIPIVVFGLIVVIFISRPIADVWKTPPVRKTLRVDARLAEGERTSIGPNWLTTLVSPPVLRGQFTTEHFPIEVEISHDGRLISLGGYFTLSIPETVMVAFETDQREWRLVTSRKAGYKAYRVGFTNLDRQYPKRLWPVPQLKFPSAGQYDCEYELDVSGQASDRDPPTVDIGKLRQRFIVNLSQ